MPAAQHKKAQARTTDSKIERQQLIHQELERVDHQDPALGCAKHIKMASNPFVFLRGSAQLFYADLAKGNLKLPEALLAPPLTTIMGDCHTSNFGFLSEEGAHGESVIFAPNDFDDACVGHAAWDLARFCTSLALCVDFAEGTLAGRYALEEALDDDQAVNATQSRTGMAAFLEQYRETCQQCAEDADNRDQVLDGFKKKHILNAPYKKAKKRIWGGKKFLEKSSLAKEVDLSKQPLRFRDRPERFKPLSADEARELIQHFEPYMDDSILDITERLNAGTGSVNMRRFYCLVGPKDFTSEEDLELCHLVEIKHQRHAAPLYHFPELSAVNRLNPAHLTVHCQQRMQRKPDLVLDEAEWQDGHWLIRSRHHARVGIDPEDIVFGEQAVKGGFEQYAATCGQALALAHCRGDRRSTRFEQTMAEVLPDQMEGLIQACLGYAEQVKEDCGYLRGLYLGE